jgi:hypothetical protein
MGAAQAGYGMNQANIWANTLANLSNQAQSGIGQYQQYKLLQDMA